jgi:hypothetical protein
VSQKAPSPQKTSLIGEGWFSLIRWLPPQDKQGGIMRLTRSPPDYNWATTHIASLPTGNSGRCPHQDEYDTLTRVATQPGRAPLHDYLVILSHDNVV